MSSLLMRLGALSLAATVVFSTVNAAPQVRKDPKAAAAVIEALVAKAVTDHNAKSDDQISAAKVLTQGIKQDSFDRNVQIGTAATNANLTVYGDFRANGDVIAGAINGDNTTAGYKHLIGITTLNPNTQQFKVIFKNKGFSSHGAFVNLDYVTTATGYRLGLADNGLVTSIVKTGNIFCHPQMSAQQVMGQIGKQNFQSAKDMKVTATSATINAAPLTTTVDFRLTPTVRIESLTKDACFGFVPYSGTYPITNSSGYGFYEAGWTNTTLNTIHPIWYTGTLSYKVASDNVTSVEVVNAVSDELVPLDVFELFTDAELAQLLSALEGYFGNNSVEMRKYLIENRFQLSRAFKALRA